MNSHYNEENNIQMDNDIPDVDVVHVSDDEKDSEIELGDITPQHPIPFITSSPQPSIPNIPTSTSVPKDSQHQNIDNINNNEYKNNKRTKPDSIIDIIPPHKRQKQFNNHHQ